MKFLGKIEDGTSNKPLNFGNDLWPWRRSALSECFSSSLCFLGFSYFLLVSESRLLLLLRHFGCCIKPLLVYLS